MNRYPLWKYLLIIVVVVVGVIYALPNLYGEDQAVQVSATRTSKVDAKTLDTVKALLEQDKVPFKRATLDERGLLVRLPDTETQLKAYDVVREALGKQYTVALNLAPKTPHWLTSINALPMYLGLDLRGGVHFLMEVDTEAAVTQALDRYRSDFRTLFRQEKVRYLTIEMKDAGTDNGRVVVKFRDAAERDAARQAVRKEFSNLVLKDYEEGGDVYLSAQLSPQEIRDTKRFAVQQNITTLRNRVNELGVAEPVIQQQGEDRVVVQLPGVQDTARAKDILGATATLEFRMVDEQHNAQQAASSGHTPPGDRLYHERNGQPVLLENEVMLTGDYITDASSGIDQQSGGPAVYITLDSKGARIFTNATKDNVGRLMAVVFIETKVESRQVEGKEVKTTRTVSEVINVARIRERLGKRFQITGLDSTEEARDLALLLRAGALAAPIHIVEERTVGPSLGQDNIDRGFQSVIIGFVLVLAFMAFYYRGFGLVANLALGMNLVLIVAVLSMLQATLTLPGIAGIVLTVGMAVDANVLIFERIREELRAGTSPHAAINAGYDKALSTIADANITTLIASIVLFTFGTGPVKGFAVTLSVGIVTSMFTAIMGTRGVVNLIYGKRRISKLSI